MQDENEANGYKTSQNNSINLLMDTEQNLTILFTLIGAVCSAVNLI